MLIFQDFFEFVSEIEKLAGKAKKIYLNDDIDYIDVVCYFDSENYIELVYTNKSNECDEHTITGILEIEGFIANSKSKVLQFTKGI